MQHLKLRAQRIISTIRYRRRRLSMALRSRKAAHLLHIGKTGGTALKNAFNDHLTDGCFDIYLHPHRTHLKDIPEGEKVFFFLRDPISRFISGFNSRKRQGMPRVFSPWNEGEKKAFSIFETPEQLAEALSSENHKLRNDAHEAMNRIQHVRDSYWRWFENESYIRKRAIDILFIGHQETLGSDFQRLSKLLGLDGTNAKLPDDEVRSHRNPQSASRSMSPIGEANLRSWYAKDQAFIDLCNELMARQHDAP